MIFYTLPPRAIPYPFILINANNPEAGLSFIAEHWRNIKSIIIDSGVEIFRDPRVKEYPGGAKAWILRLVQLYRRIIKIVPNAHVVVTCGDYPDDYNPGSLWINEKVTNVERTAENVRLCTSLFPDVNWLIPVQGWYRNPAGLLLSIEYYWNMGVFDRYRHFAIANLCVEVDTDLIHRSVLAVRRRLKELGVLDRVSLHIFGLKIAALRKIKDLIHSFDSTAWTRPVDSRVRKIRNASCKTERERIAFFCEYVKRLKVVYGVEIPDSTLESCRRLGAFIA